MHEIRVTVPEGRAKDVAALALQAGVQQATVYKVFAYGPNRGKEIVSAEISTPIAKKFADSVITSPWFDARECSITTRQLRAIVGAAHPREVTRPMLEPPINVFEDLWQLNHLTVSYYARAIAGAALLAYGMVLNDPVTIVIAALFLPFLSQSIALGFGPWAGDWGLARQGLKALTVSTAASIASGAAIAALHGPPMLFHGYLAPLPSLLISAAIGVTAGFSTADDAGRRYLIGVAAAVQFGVFPIWFGFSLLEGFPDQKTTLVRIGTFGINVFTITVFALIGYLLLDIKRKDVRAWVRQRAGKSPESAEQCSEIQA